MIRRYLILSVFALQTLAGCTYLFPVRKDPEAMRAESLIESGKHKEAAAIYKQLASLKSDRQNEYRLLAADALIRGNNIKQAKEYTSMINVGDLENNQRAHLDILQAQMALSEGKAEQALKQLKAVPSESLNYQTKPSYYQSLAFAYSLTSDALQSAQALINAGTFLHSTTAKYKNYQEILSTLSFLSKEDLHVKQPPSSPVLNGWMSLAKVFKSGAVNLDDNLAKWKKSYPTHPANSAFLADYVKNYYMVQSGLIAVFLPESGSFAGPAAVIKSGFMQAHKLAQKNTGIEREIRFYDTEKDSISNLYKQAVKDGARLVIGPLDKKDITSLVDSSELTIPVLALNYVEGLSHANLYQFALTPLDDAEQITLKAYKDGYQNALFLVPKTEQGKRFAGYFDNNWQKLGGKIVKVQGYDDSKTNFSELVQEILPQKQHSQAIDTIILNAYAKPARFLYPALQKTDLPVYATSQIYLGDENPARDKNLESLTFCDVPWVFPKVYSGALSKNALYDSWGSLSPSYIRLLPMGIDAYHLIGELNHLKDKPYNGATGKLRLDNSNRVTRELFCAKFVDGIPKELNYASEGLAIEAAPETKQAASEKNSNEKGKSTTSKLPNLDDVLDSLPNTNSNNAVTQ